jgi:hypothetical protein
MTAVATMATNSAFTAVTTTHAAVPTHATEAAEAGATVGAAANAAEAAARSATKAAEAAEAGATVGTAARTTIATRATVATRAALLVRAAVAVAICDLRKAAAMADAMTKRSATRTNPRHHAYPSEDRCSYQGSTSRHAGEGFCISRNRPSG